MKEEAQNEVALEGLAMILTFTSEQERLRASVRSFIAANSTDEDVREVGESDAGHDTRIWRQMAQQLGLQSLGLPAEYGGSGSFVEVAIVLEEMGRRLFVSPYLATVLAASAVACSGDRDVAEQILPRIADGDIVATLALVEESGRWDERGVQMQAEVSSGTYRLSGTKLFVLDGCVADIFVVAARTDGQVSLFLVDRGAAGLTTVALEVVDQTRPQARIDFADTPAVLVGALGEGWQTLSKVLDIAAIGLAAEQVGGIQYVVDTAVECARTRTQFGRPNGSFEAAKHRCADMLLRLESAKSAAYYATKCVAKLPDQVPVFASLAKSHCSEAYFRCAADNIQILGGIGFTWEHHAHRYFKRAKSSELMFGDPVYHRELFAQRVGR